MGHLHRSNLRRARVRGRRARKHRRLREDIYTFKPPEPIGTLFVSLIKMMISPVIFCTIVLGIGSVTPLVVRGKAPVMSWVPQRLLAASEDTQARLLDLYQHTDPKLAVALEARIRLAALGPTAASEAAMADGAPFSTPLKPTKPATPITTLLSVPVNVSVPIAI